MTQRFLVVGAGLSGAVLARVLAEAGHSVTVVEARDHVGGLCHMSRDPETGVMLHHFGPHVFHTNDAEVWAYVNRFETFRRFAYRGWSMVQGQVYALPVTLRTINRFLGTSYNPDDAQRALQGFRTQQCGHAANFRDAAIARVGPEIYAAFFEGYTRKHWGIDPAELPAAILDRLPISFSEDAPYFAQRFQAMPEAGYTVMTQRILDHHKIGLTLSHKATRADASGFDHVFCTAPVDCWFDHALGRLSYRTLDFERFVHDGDYQGCAVMNFADSDIPWRRVIEHRHFAPWERHARSVIFREFARDCGPDDPPYYPIPRMQRNVLLSEYEALAQQDSKLTFLGRLGTYRYINMDTAIRQALDCARRHLSCAPGARAAMSRVSS